MKYFTFILIFLLISCTEKKQTESVKKYEEKRIGRFQYLIKDTISEIVISHQECTECLDAFRESGKIFISEKLMFEIQKTYTKKNLAFIPNGNDLYLIGEKNISEKLFGKTLSLQMSKKYLIKGKVIGFKNYGYIFRIDNYKEINAETK